MVAVFSTMLPLGTKAPNFKLRDVYGKTITLSDYENYQAYLIAFICNHCPYVLHIRSTLSTLAKEYYPRVATFGINSNDTIQYPEDSVAKMKEEPYTFPYLFDETQEVAKAYRAACTPDFFLFDREKKLVYRGQFDESRPANLPATGSTLRKAIEATFRGQMIPEGEQIPSMGCNIKWKKNNAPDYFRS